MAAQEQHITDDGLTGLCGESLVVDEPLGPTCPACQQQATSTRYVWPRIGPALLGLVWIGGMNFGRELYLRHLNTAGRLAVLALVTAALYGVIILAGRVRPDNTGGES